MDNAGNVSPRTPPLAFTVDASLPINGTSGPGAAGYTGGSPSGGGGTSGTNVMIIGLIAGVGALLVAMVVVGVVALRRRAVRRAMYIPPPHVGGMAGPPGATGHMIPGYVSELKGGKGHSGNVLEFSFP